MVSFVHDRMRFFFIHIPKTGGVSVTRFFFPTSDVRAARLNFSLKNSGIGIHDGVNKIEKLLDGDADRYFSFAFYRNSWDWAYSLYRYIKRTTNHPKHPVVNLSFEEYVLNFSRSFHRPQAPMVAPEGVCRIKRLEDFGDFSTAFFEIVQELGFEDVNVPHQNAAASSRSYRNAYTREMMLALGDQYEEDISYFGFKF